MNKTVKGLIFGALAGLIDIAPMLAQKLPIDANVSTFTMWVIIGYLLTVTDIKVKGALKGIVISFLVLAPAAVLIGWKEPISLLPVGIMTFILGALLGFLLDK